MTEYVKKPSSQQRRRLFYRQTVKIMDRVSERDGQDTDALSGR